MTLHPIAVVDRVLDEYRGHLRTEFRARDEKLRDALEAAMLQPTFLAQEPFFQAHRPFKPGKRWPELGLHRRRVGPGPSSRHHAAGRLDRPHRPPGPPPGPELDAGGAMTESTEARRARLVQEQLRHEGRLYEYLAEAVRERALSNQASLVDLCHAAEALGIEVAVPSTWLSRSERDLRAAEDELREAQERLSNLMAYR